MIRQFTFQPTEIPTVLTFEMYCKKRKKNPREELIKAIHLYFNEELNKPSCKVTLEKSIKGVSKNIEKEKIFKELKENNINGD